MPRRTSRLAVAAALPAALLLGVTAAFADVSAAIEDEPRPITEWGYTPQTLYVPAGSWVTWSNLGMDAHAVTALDGAFDSGILQPSEGFSWYFDVPGTFDYVCPLHDWMSGRVLVADGADAAPALPAETDGDTLPAGADDDAAHPTPAP